LSTPARLAACLLLASLTVEASAEEAAFEIQRIPAPMRVVQAELSDLDGDGRGDLVWIGVKGLPPQEVRRIHVHYGNASGVLPEAADWARSLPGGVAAYDLADIDQRPGAELLLLRRDRVTEISFAERSPRQRDILVPGEPTIAAVYDERGVDRLQLAREGLGAPWRLVIPGLGRTTLLETSGELIAHLDVGARGNFFIPPRAGPLFSESEIEIYLDHPRVTGADVDGDGRRDLVSTNRHEVRVFRQREDGGFAAAPQQRVALGLLPAEDHIRSSGSVRGEPTDIDGDGRADLVLATAFGTILGSKTEIHVYRNRGGTWDLSKPDQRFENDAGFSTHQIVDLDGDGRVELVDIRIPSGVLELVEFLLTQAIDAEIEIRRTADAKPFQAEPWQAWKIGLGMDFETFRPRGFVPTIEADLDGDGMRDLLGSGDGERIEIRLGDREKGFRELHASQPLDTSGRVRFGDANGDAFADFLIYDPRRPDLPIRIGRNRGRLGRTPRLVPAPEDEVTSGTARPASDSIGSPEDGTPAAPPLPAE